MISRRSRARKRIFSAEEVALRGRTDLLSGTQFAARVGVSANEVSKLHRDGVFLAAIDGARGRGKQRLYTPEQIDDCRLVLKGRAQPRALPLMANPFNQFADISAEDAQVGFRALHAKKALTDIVLEDGIHPDVVMALTHAWAKLTGGIFVPGEMLEKISLLTLNGPLPIRSDQDLYEVLVIAAEDQACMICNKQKSAICKKCVSTTLSQMRQEERERIAPSTASPQESSPQGESLHATISPG
jgi:hypothetical protein